MMIIAEAFGAIALVLNFIGYRQNHVDRYLLISAIALAALSVHFYLLGAMAASVGTGLASIRNLIALKNRSTYILVFFVFANIAFLLYEWFYLNHGAIILVAYASSLIFRVNCHSRHSHHQKVLFTGGIPWPHLRHFSGKYIRHAFQHQ